MLKTEFRLLSPSVLIGPENGLCTTRTFSVFFYPGIVFPMVLGQKRDSRDFPPSLVESQSRCQGGRRL